jgi:hypothetical protein
MDEKITIIEGPPPTFEPVNDSWVIGLPESPIYGQIVLTRLRTFNGPAMIERCNHAWRNHQIINLEYRKSDGLIQKDPIIAARFMEVDEGHLLMLWIRLVNDEVEVQVGFEDDLSDDDED